MLAHYFQTSMSKDNWFTSLSLLIIRIHTSSTCLNNKQNVCKDRFTFSHFLIYFSLPFQEGRINSWWNKWKKIKTENELNKGLRLLKKLSDINENKEERTEIQNLWKQLKTYDILVW